MIFHCQVLSDATLCCCHRFCGTICGKWTMNNSFQNPEAYTWLSFFHRLTHSYQTDMWQLVWYPGCSVVLGGTCQGILLCCMESRAGAQFLLHVLYSIGDHCKVNSKAWAIHTGHGFPIGTVGMCLHTPFLEGILSV